MSNGKNLGEILPLADSVLVKVRRYALTKKVPLS